MTFFNPESQPWRALGRAVDFVGLSLCTVFISLGVVTFGPALTALYTAVVKEFRYGDNTPFRTYFESFRKNLKQGMVLTLICIPVIVLIVLGYLVMKENSSTRAGAFLFTFYYVLLIIPAGTMINIFPMLGRFEMSTGKTIRTSFTFVFAHLPSTLVLVLLSTELTVWTVQYWSPAFITPSLWALLSSFFLEKNYRKHLTPAECAALEGISEEEYLEKEREKEEFRSRFRRRK